MRYQKEISSAFLIRIFLIPLLMFFAVLPAYASFNDCATDWNNFANNPGYISGYTYKGNYIMDFQATGSGDPSHGSANVPPAETDLASAATAGTNPGPQTTPFFGYYNGGTVYDPNNPSTMNDDYIFFRMRVSGDPSANGTDFKSYHWNILFDVDGDGYKEYWVDLEGSCTQQVCGGNYDRLNILYSNLNNQLINDPDAAGVRVDYFRAYNSADTASCGGLGYSHTRTYAVGDGSPDYYIDVQVPFTAFKDSQGNQVLTPDSPVAFVFSTGASNQDPLQKDWMMDLNYLSDADPITFGDIIIPSGKPIIEFADSALNFLSYYTIGDQVYVYVSDRLANTNGSQVEYINVTVTNPVTGDDEVVTLGETSADTGIFTNAGCGVCNALTVAASDGISNNSDNSSSIEAVSGNTLYVSYTNPNSLTVTDQAGVVAPGEPFIEFTRADGTPSTNFMLTTNPNTSDELYVTVYHNAANTNPAARNQITVTLSGMDNQTITLYETGVNTGVFINYFDSGNNGLQTKISDGTVTSGDNLWEDVDGGTVTATYTHGGNNYTANASLFYTAGAGRVYFTNQVGTLDVSLYTPGQLVYLKVADITYTCVGPLTVVVTSPTGDSETKVLTETFAGSGVYMNSSSPLAAAVFDGVYVQGDGTLEAADGDTLTVTYYDCNDGDSNAANNNKTDTALFNAPPLLINEVLFYPYPDCPAPPCEPQTPVQSEYIQIYNASNQSITATGYRVTDGDSFNYTIPQLDASDIVLNPGQKLYVSIYPVGGTPGTNFFDAGTNSYYIFTSGGGTSLPSDEFGDPAASAAADRADQLSLYNASNALVDYVGWSATTSPSVDFLGDDSPAVTSDIWQDDAYVNVNGIQAGYSIYRCQGGVAQDGYDTNQPSDWCVSASPSTVSEVIITYASISSFGAYYDGSSVIVEWKTSSESDTVGFYLLRLNEKTGGYEAVANDMVPSVMDRRGGVYRIVDGGAAAGGSYTYLLLEIEGLGTKRTYGPFKVKVKQKQNGGLNNGTFSRERHELTKTQKIRIKAGKDTKEAAKIKKAKRVGEQLKMAITGEGVYTLDAARIASLLGMPEKSVMGMIKTEQLMITNNGQQVAYQALSGGRGLIFYGAGADGIYTDENVYWLSKGKGLPMETVATTVVPGPVSEETFADRKHFEEDWFDAPGFFTDPSVDYWFWDYVFGGFPGYDRKSFVLNTGGVARASSYNAELTVGLQGASDTEVNPDHHAVVRLNGNNIGEIYWDGMGNTEKTFSFSQTLLNDGDNTVEITDLLDTGVEYSAVFVNSFDVAYQRLYLAEGDKLVFRGDGNQSVGISGFTGPEIMLFDITDRRAPKSMKGAVVEAASGGYRLKFSPPSPSAVYLAVGRGRVAAVSEITADVPSALKGKVNRADYLIITSAELRAEAEALAAYRRSGGLEAMVIDLEDIMDEFSFGIYDPEAIRSFLSYAHANWMKAPKYVVLAGDGTDDYRDRTGYGGNLVPPVMVGTKDGLVPADNYYADVNGDHIPDMAIGRLPAVTSEELRDMISKIITYEDAAARTGGRKMVLAADYPEAGGEFVSDSESVRLLLSQGYPVTTVYLSEQSFDSARQMLIAGLNSGLLFLNYIGHAGLDRLSQDGLLTVSDLDAMTNAGRLPVMTAMTCIAGNFTVAGFDSLAEEMVTRKDVGVVAAWTASGMSESKESILLDREFYRAVFRGGERVLGAAVLKAFEGYMRQGRDPNIPYLYNLIGDPALRMTVK